MVFAKRRPDAEESVERLRRHTVGAVYRDLDGAARAVQAVRELGVDDRRIVFRDRRLTDEGPADRVEGPVPMPDRRKRETVASPTARRDLEVANRVLWRAGLRSALVAAVGGATAFLAYLWLAGGLETGVWAITAVGAAAGAVLGGMWGGTFGAWNEARREEGVLVEVHTDDLREVQRVAGTLRRHGPIRLDRLDPGLGASAP